MPEYSTGVPHRGSDDALGRVHFITALIWLRGVHNEKPWIDFVAHFAYGTVAGGDSWHIDGVER